METDRLCYSPAALDLLRVADQIAPNLTDEQKEAVSYQAQYLAASEHMDEVQTYHVTEVWTKFGYTAQYGKLIYWQ